MKKYIAISTISFFLGSGITWYLTTIYWAANFDGFFLSLTGANLSNELNLLYSNEKRSGSAEDLESMLQGSICDRYERLQCLSEGNVEWDLYGANFLTKKFTMEYSEHDLEFVESQYSKYLSQCKALTNQPTAH